MISSCVIRMFSEPGLPSVLIMSPRNPDPRPDNTLATIANNSEKKLPFSFDPGSKSDLFTSGTRSILSLSASAQGRHRSNSISHGIALQRPLSTRDSSSDFSPSPLSPLQLDYNPSPLALSSPCPRPPENDFDKYASEIERLKKDLDEFKRREQKKSGQYRHRDHREHRDGRSSTSSSNYSTTYKDASLIVHERVVIVTPRVLITQGEAAHETPHFQTPQPSFDEAQDLVDIANNISPLSTDFSIVDTPFHDETPRPSHQEARDLAQLAYHDDNIDKVEFEKDNIDEDINYQVTVTDEDTQSQVELDFTTPTPPPESEHSDKNDEEDDDFLSDEDDLISRNLQKKIQTTIKKDVQEEQIQDISKKPLVKVQEQVKPKEYIEEIKVVESKGAEKPAFQKIPSKKPLPEIKKSTKTERLKSSPVTGRKKPPLSTRANSVTSELVDRSGSQVSGHSFDDSDDDSKYVERIRRNSMRDRSIERPSWGFGNSRVPSRQDVGEELGGGQTRRTHSRAPSRSPSKTDVYANTGMTYDDVLNTSNTGNTLMPGRKLTRRDSNVSMRSNVSSKWKEDLKNYQAIKVTIYKNGDQWFNGFEMRFKPNKDYLDLDAFLGKISPRIDFTTSVSYLFDTDGNRIKTLQEFEDGQSYVASNTRRFVPANYGRNGEAFWLNGKRYSRNNQYRKRSGGSLSSSTDSKPGSGDGKVIKIVNNEDTNISEKVLLNLRTSQTFEEVVRDLGQVLKIKAADKMYTTHGSEVKSFSQLRNDFQGEDVFIISSGPARVARSVSRMSRTSGAGRHSGKIPSRSSSRTRDTDSPVAGSIKILINGARKIFYAPHDHPRDPGTPGSKLGLEWVYGYRGADQNKNLWVLEKGELVYYVGAIAIVYNRMDERQRHYRGHSEDIQCMDLHPLGDIAVSGQLSGQSAEGGAQVRIWDVHSMDTLQVLGLGSLEMGVSGLSFSVLNKGAYVAAVDNSKEKVMHMWDWRANELLSKVNVDADIIAGISFHPFDNNLVITHGKSHLAFWNRKKDGFFARADLADSAATYQCLAYLESGDVVIGDSEGNISVYSVSAEGDYYRTVVWAGHSRGGVASLLVLAQGTLLSAGDRDRRVVAWDSNRDFVVIGEAELPSSAGSGRTLYPQWPTRNDGNVYVGTCSNIILEGSIQRKFNMVLYGHTKPISAVSTHPSDASFVTVGSDKMVAKWRRSKLIWKSQLQSVCLSVTHHPGGAVVAIGTTDGHMIIVTEDSGTHVTTVRLCGAGINGIKYNLDGDLVAGASQNGSLYIYKVSRDGFAYKKYSKISGGQMLTQVDWDHDGNVVQTSSHDHVLSFWSTETNKLEKVPSVMRTRDWADQTCVLGWAVAGLWSNHNYKHVSNVETVHVSRSKELIVSGHSAGQVRLFGYPCMDPKSECHEDKAVSGPIACTRFFYDDSYVIAVGGLEAAILKYKVK